MGINASVFQVRIKAIAESLARTAYQDFSESSIALLSFLGGATFEDTSIDLRDKAYTKLVMEIETAMIRELLHMCDMLSNMSETEPSVQILMETVRNVPVIALGLPVCLSENLKNAGFDTIGDIVDVHVADVMDVCGFGDMSVDVLSLRLAEYGVDWPAKTTLSEITPHR